LTVRVIIADAFGCVVREWQYGQGITSDLRHRANVRHAHHQCAGDMQHTPERQHVKEAK